MSNVEIDDKDYYCEPSYINKEKLLKCDKPKKSLWGKGKFRATTEKLLATTAIIVETLKGCGIWNYAENIAIGNLTTKFNTWVATLKAGDVPLTAGQWQTLTNSVANTFGVVFSTVLTFVIEHPTVTVLGVGALTTTLLVPFKALVRKVKGIKERKNQEIVGNKAIKR